MIEHDASGCHDANRRNLHGRLDKWVSVAHANVKAGEVKAFSEQGYKVWRARVTGVTAEQAGDAHNAKVEAEATA